MVELNGVHKGETSLGKGRADRHITWLSYSYVSVNQIRSVTCGTKSENCEIMEKMVWEVLNKSICIFTVVPIAGSLTAPQSPRWTWPYSPKWSCPRLPVLSLSHHFHLESFQTLTAAFASQICTSSWNHQLRDLFRRHEQLVRCPYSYASTMVPSPISFSLDPNGQSCLPVFLNQFPSSETQHSDCYN